MKRPHPLLPPHWSGVELDPSEIEALGAITREFSGRERASRAVRWRAPRSSDSEEWVYGLGEDTRDAAELYARMTGRQARVMPNAEIPDPLPTPSVVVLFSRDLSPELFERLYTRPTAGPAPGIVCAGSAAELRRQVVVRAAAACLVARTPPAQGGFVPSFYVSSRGALARDATRAQIRSVLSRGASVLTLATHSDGIDADLGRLVTLCPMAAALPDADGENSPRCAHTGYCHRRFKPVNEARRLGELLSPSAIRARVFVFGTCMGLLMPGGVIDPAWGLGPSLLGNTRLGAVITTWEILVLDPHDALDLSALVADGVPLGPAVAWYNRSSHRRARHYGYRFCLFGDPRVCAAPVEHAPPPERRALPHARSASFESTRASSPLADLRGLQACIRQSARGASETMKSSSLAAQAAIEAFHAAARDGERLEGDPGAAGPRMREAVLRYLEECGNVAGHWSELAERKATRWMSAPCPACGRVARTCLLQLVRATGRRRLTFCPICGLVEDLPASSDLRVEADPNGLVRLWGTIPDHAWNGQVQLWTQHVPSRRTWRWPAGEDGRPRTSFQSPEPWAAGPYRLGVVFIWGGELAMAARMIRVPREQTGRLPPAGRVG